MTSPSYRAPVNELPDPDYLPRRSLGERSRMVRGSARTFRTSGRQPGPPR